MRFSILFITILLSSCVSKAPTLPFSTQHHAVTLEPINDWTERKFADSTRYSIKTIKGKNALSATSNASASMLYKKIKIDLRKTPYLNWQWLIDSTITSNHNEKTRNGDDFSARVYVAIKPAELEIKPRAITYVWANAQRQFDSWKNPFSDNIMMMALQTGNKNSQQWVSEKRNLKQDLERFFGSPINFIEGIAVMSDSDNTKTTTNASYSHLFFSSD